MADIASPSRYTFVPYSTDWPAEFERESERLRGLLGDALVTVHHIGSTSVPGLAAKPIIDVLPCVTSLEAVEAATPRLAAAGYRAWGAYGLPGRRYFTRDRDGWRTHNVHIYRVDDRDVTRHLAFAAFLRHHPDVRDAYAAVKRDAYARHPADIAAYADAKDAWIKRVERDALAWFTAARAGVAPGAARA